MTNVVFDEFKFLTREELDQMGCSNLIGTKMLKENIHGK